MKTPEYNHGGNWLDRLLNAWPLCLDADSIRTVAVAWDEEGICFPDRRSLFNNGYVSLRLTFPFGAWLHVKVRPTWRIQSGVGWKLNGRVACNPYGIALAAGLAYFFGWSWWLLLLVPFYRKQSDKSAAAGAHENAPNLGQATGWERGTA